ncbi:MAG: EF-hand domain-containing protein [Verrucomicrobiota bacterium]
MNRFVSIFTPLAIALAPAFADEDRSGLDVGTLQEFSGLDRNRDSGLDRLEFAFSEIAQRAREIGDRDKVDRIFELIDADGDGVTSLIELARSQPNRNVRIFDRESARGFGKLDADDSGILTLSEYLDSSVAKNAIENGKSKEFVSSAFKRLDLNETKAIGPIEWLQAIPGKQLLDDETVMVFTAIDTDDNGAISSQEKAEISPETPELLQFVEAFERIDLNGNGELGAREFAKAQQADPAADGGRKDPIFVELDRNEDGALSQREFSRYAPKDKSPPRGVLDDIFERLDENNDRELSPQEFASRRGQGILKGKGPFKGPGKKGKRP